MYSIGECTIADILDEKDINYVQQFSFDDLIGPGNGKLLFDFAIFENGKLSCLIEYQGIQHYKDFGVFGKQQRQITDKAKIDYCKERNISLFEIKYDENINNRIDEILLILHDNTVPNLE